MYLSATIHLICAKYQKYKIPIDTKVLAHQVQRNGVHANAKF